VPASVETESDRCTGAGGTSRSANSFGANHEHSGLTAGFEFVVGEHYLITASDGNVNFCGYNGVGAPELTAAFDAAFPG
jgi:hypothetical protein